MNTNCGVNGNSLFFVRMTTSTYLSHLWQNTSQSDCRYCFVSPAMMTSIHSSTPYTTLLFVLTFYVTFFIVLSSSRSVSSFYLHNYTRVLLYHLPHPTTFVFLYCVVFFSKFYSSFRLFTTYAIFFYSLLLSPPFHFPFLEKYEMDLAFIRKSFATVYTHYATWNIKINFP